MARRSIIIKPIVSEKSEVLASNGTQNQYAFVVDRKANKIEILRICNFFKCSEVEVTAMFNSKSLDSEIILKWSKLLEYDFFRIYSQHLILYAPPSAENKIVGTRNTKITLPHFRKNIYTKEIINFLLEQINSGYLQSITSPFSFFKGI